MRNVENTKYVVFFKKSGALERTQIHLLESKADLIDWLLEVNATNQLNLSLNYGPYWQNHEIEIISINELSKIDIKLKDEDIAKKIKTVVYKEIKNKQDDFNQQEQEIEQYKKYYEDEYKHKLEELENVKKNNENYINGLLNHLEG